MKIVLACHGGFSTSMLANKMKDYAVKIDRNIDIDAIPSDSIESIDMDLLLLGPQIAHQLESLSEELNIPVRVINSVDYGTMNGEKVLDFALKVLGED